MLQLGRSGVLVKWGVGIALAFLLCLNSALADSVNNRSFLQMGKPVKEVAFVYRDASRSSGEVLRIEMNEQCEIIGSAEKYYFVRFKNQTGYVQKNQLRVTPVQAAVEEALCASLTLETTTPNRHTSYLALQGSITASEPLQTLFAYVWDERQQEIEHVYTKRLSQPAQVIDADSLQRMLPLNKLSGGRKTLVIEGCSAKETVVLFRSLFYAYGDLQEPKHITGRCKGIPGVLLDDKIATAWVPRKAAPLLTIEIPPNASASLMTLEWKEIPDTFTVEQFDEQGKLLSREVKKTGFYADSISLHLEAHQLVIAPEGEKVALGNLRIYAMDYPAHEIQTWSELPDKIDILLISTHQDDEFLFFGGSIPYYAAREDVTIGVLYMADCGRARYREALDGLWTAGLRHYPIFLNLKDYYTKSTGKAAALWRKNDPGKLLVQIIRQYKPEVILTHDFNGEYGHGQHKYTAQIAAEYSKLAAEKDFDPASAEKWGTWKIKKVYSHLYEENQIQMDWHIALDDSGVITPMFLAWEGYDKSKSQLAAFSMERDGAKYDNTLFGLYWSSVGPDVKKNDFMENIK